MKKYGKINVNYTTTCEKTIDEVSLIFTAKHVYLTLKISKKMTLCCVTSSFPCLRLSSEVKTCVLPK
jgi:hypothetical protein